MGWLLDTFPDKHYAYLFSYWINIKKSITAWTLNFITCVAESMLLRCCAIEEERGELYQDTLEIDSFPQTLPPPINRVTEVEAETVRIN
jgi:hypothetical protein